MKLSIAIPSTSVSDGSTQLEKSRKISIIARACAIFKVSTIYIYHEGGKKQDISLLVTILKYLETPQFLRRKLFPKINNLKYAGVLHPLKIPSHITNSNIKNMKPGEVREGLTFIHKGKKFIDLGINYLIPYYGKKKVGNRITVIIESPYPELKIKEISKEEISNYWGYQIKERSNLFSFLSEWEGSIILTSRKGKPISEKKLNIVSESSTQILVVFGSTDKGLHQILGNKIKNIQNAKILNFFPGQGTETIRLEEAILGSLSILNAKKK